jgi:hypothetical protein
MWSALVAVVGVLATAGLARRQAARPEREPFAGWLLGLAAFGPAALVEFIALLGVAAGEGGAPRGFFMAPVGVGLLGVIGTDAWARRLRESGAPRAALVYWLLGALALLPAWLAGLLLRLSVRP